MKRLKQYLCNAALLTLTTLFMRGVALAFNVFVSNKVGAEALGLFSLISSVYGFALTLATSGISLATTRMVAEALGHDDDSLAISSMQRCFAYSVFFGISAASLLFFLAPVISSHWLDDQRTLVPLRLMAISLPLIAVCSALNGYFTAVRRVAKNAASQVAEQAIKITVTTLLLMSVLPEGIENACIALILGSTVSEIFSFFLMMILYIRDRKKYLKGSGRTENGGAVTARLLGIALPVAFSTYARSGLLTVEHILIPDGLRKSGASREHSLAAYGTFQSMAFPVILFPAALIASFAGMTIPELSDCLARGHKNRVRYIAGRVWQFSLIFSIGVSGILLCFSGEIGMLFYNSEEAAEYIRLLAPLIPVMYLDSTTDAMLKGLGHQFYSMNINIIDAAISVVLVKLLIPRFGINGYIFIVFAMEVLNFGLSATKLLCSSGMKPRLIPWILKPLLCTVGSTVFTSLAFRFLPQISIPWLSLTLHILTAILLYLIMLAVTGTLDREDREWLRGVFRKDKDS